MKFTKFLKRLFNRCQNNTQPRQLNSLLINQLSFDKEVNCILHRETQRQITSLELIASENFTSTSVLQANGTVFTNKYSEGYPRKRYYGGNEFIDELEEVCQQRALEAFNLNPEEWGVNVQSYSGSTANFAVYTGLLKPGDRLMGLDLPSGGHLTHGYATPTKKISNSAIYFESKPYVVGSDFLIDFSELEQRASEFKPHLIIVGASAYPRDFDYARFRQIADKSNSFLMADIAHISGLVASKLLNNPFEYCDVVTTTTHKTLRGPRAALIFYKKQLKDRIDFAVFPSSQGGPHNNTIAAVAVALKQVNSEEFINYSKQVISNAQYLASALQKYGFDIVTNGTDNHIVLVNLKSKGITGSKFEKIAELCNVSVNKNTIATDKSALNPSGIRLGTPAMTSRGFVEGDFQFVTDTLNDICNLVIKIQEDSPSNKLVDFMKTSESYHMDIHIIKQNVEKYCAQFPLPQ
jgi:glycine hydroxymethyltransferase